MFVLKIFCAFSQKSHHKLLKKYYFVGPSLVAQWWGIHLPMQETQVWSLIQKDPAFLEETEPVCHGNWACALQPALESWQAATSEPTHLRAQALRRETTAEKPMSTAWEQPRSPQLEESPGSNEDPAQPKNKKNKIKKRILHINI